MPPPSCRIGSSAGSGPLLASLSFKPDRAHHLLRAAPGGLGASSCLGRRPSPTLEGRSTAAPPDWTAPACPLARAASCPRILLLALAGACVSHRNKQAAARRSPQLGVQGAPLCRAAQTGAGWLAGIDPYALAAHSPPRPPTPTQVPTIAFGHVAPLSCAPLLPLIICKHAVNQGEHEPSSSSSSNNPSHKAASTPTLKQQAPWSSSRPPPA